jgi:hypothetical protein
MHNSSEAHDFESILPVCNNDRFRWNEGRMDTATKNIRINILKKSSKKKQINSMTLPAPESSAGLT